MGFLDNSGDIILDAVLTDLGRERLARGDGSFKITKFAAADDEIDYGKYDKNHASGSAYYDLDILTTPVLEAFTNNIGSCKHKLMTIPRNNLLYLPVIKLVNSAFLPASLAFTGGSSPFSDSSTGMYVISVDQDTSDVTRTDSSPVLQPLTSIPGIIKGDGISAGAGVGGNGTLIALDQGLDTAKIPDTFSLDADLIENQYMIEIDDRLGKITTPGPASNQGNTAMQLVGQNFVDDDRIASYYVSKNTNGALFDSSYGTVTGTGGGPTSVIAGPRGNRLWFAIRASLELNTSESLFDRLGGTVTMSNTTSSPTFKYIDSTVRITGITTGYRIDVPVRFLKKV